MNKKLNRTTTQIIAIEKAIHEMSREISLNSNNFDIDQEISDGVRSTIIWAILSKNGTAGKKFQQNVFSVSFFSILVFLLILVDNDTNVFYSLHFIVIDTFFMLI